MKKKEIVRRQNEWEAKVGGVPLFIGVWEHTGVSTQSAGKYNKIMHTGATAETPVCYFIICMHIGVVENADMHIKKIITHIGVPQNADMYINLYNIAHRRFVDTPLCDILLLL